MPYVQDWDFLLLLLQVAFNLNKQFIIFHQYLNSNNNLKINFISLRKVIYKQGQVKYNQVN